MASTHLHQIRLTSGLNILAGLWLVMSPYGFGYYLVNPPFWNSVAVGFAVAILAIVRVVLPFSFVEIGWINFGLGAYLAISPFLFGFADLAPALWNSVLVGIFIMIMAAWSAVAGSRGARVISTAPR